MTLLNFDVGESGKSSYPSEFFFSFLKIFQGALSRITHVVVLVMGPFWEHLYIARSLTFEQLFCLTFYILVPHIYIHKLSIPHHFESFTSEVLFLLPEDSIFKRLLKFTLPIAFLIVDWKAVPRRLKLNKSCWISYFRRIPAKWWAVARK